MRLSSEHIRFIAEKIARELSTSKLVTFVRGEGDIVSTASKYLAEEIKLERFVDAEVNHLMDEQEDNIDLYQADRRQLFWLIKRKVAEKAGLILNRDERCNAIAHRILDELYEEDMINYSVSENIVKNLISKAISDYSRRQDELEDRIHEKLRHYKRNILRGTEEYEILFAKLYEEELAKLGV
ncbi:MAG: DUF507 family protein [Helicobacteraceae bacterium]|jgi:hypothetical protein|nr:DUF507 family protein [Helicobacteraceae bacterium]